MMFQENKIWLVTVNCCSILMIVCEFFILFSLVVSPSLFGVGYPEMSLVKCGMRKGKCGIQNAERSAEWCVKRGMRKGQSVR